MGAARVGRTLGNFRILECLGSGGSGMIWKAEDLSLDRVVALKALRPELAADREMSRRFRAEARALAKLSHANIASLYSLIEDDDGLFLVLEYVEGNTLAALLATSGALPLDTAYALFHQVLDGVGHAHDAGVVHRDLKPGNLMVDGRGRVKVMDFGIARVAGAERTTHHGKLVGTPEYMSPEQVHGEDATIRSDIYSLGIVLFEMVTGAPPFRGPASFELMRSQIEDAPPDPRALRPELGAGVAAAILRALEKRPSDRFATTHELQEALVEAGAARHGRSIAPIWRDVPRATSASEAPTQGQLGAQGEVSATAPPAPVASPAEATDPATELLDATGLALLPAPKESDAAQAGASGVSDGAGARGKAAPTVVLDVSQDTTHLDAVRLTRVLDAAHVSRPLAAGRPLEPRALGRALAWGLAAAAILALALGLVRLRALHTPSEAPAVRRAAREVAPPRAAPTPPAETPRHAEVPVGPRTIAKATPAPTAKPKHVAPKAAEPPAPAPKESSGWVIRR
jgi:serine/threonine-protein kinase